jgi:hypothetical protein
MLSRAEKIILFLVHNLRFLGISVSTEGLEALQQVP